MPLLSSDVASWAPAYQRALHAVQTLGADGSEVTLDKVLVRMNETRPSATPQFTPDLVEILLNALMGSGFLAAKRGGSCSHYLATPSAPIITAVRTYYSGSRSPCRSKPPTVVSPPGKTLPAAPRVTPTKSLS